MTTIEISQDKMTDVFNEWARRYSETPEEFGDVLDENGKPLEDYGKWCTHYFEEIANEMDEDLKIPRTDGNNNE